jgi:hypothetical protein
MQRENLSYLPPSLALRKEVEDGRAAASRAGSEAEVRRIVEALNDKIRAANRLGMSGPPLNLMTFDVDAVVHDCRARSWARRWRADAGRASRSSRRGPTSGRSIRRPRPGAATTPGAEVAETAPRLRWSDPWQPVCVRRALRIRRTAASWAQASPPRRVAQDSSPHRPTTRSGRWPRRAPHGPLPVAHGLGSRAMDLAVDGRR